MVNIPQYQQSELIQGMSANPLQEQRIVSPLETVATSATKVLTGIADRDLASYEAEKSAMAQTKVYDVANEINQKIQNNEILDKKDLLNQYKSRMQEEIDNLQLPSGLYKKINPTIIKIQGLQEISLEQALIKKREEIKAANMNESLDKIQKVAVNAPDENSLNIYVGQIKDIINSAEGTLLTPEQKQVQIQNRMDQIFVYRYNRLMDIPGVDANDLMKDLETKREILSPETYEKTRSVLSNEIQKQDVDDLYYTIDEQLNNAQTDSRIDLSSIKTAVESNKDKLGRQITSSFLNQIAGIQKVRQNDTAELASNQIERLAAFERYGEARELLKQKRGLLNENQFQDALLKIDIAEKNEYEKEEFYNQRANIPIISADVRTGKYDELNEQGFKDQVDLMVAKKLVPSSAREQLFGEFENRKIDRYKEKLEVEEIRNRLDSGLKLSESQAKKMYNSNLVNDPIQLEEFIKTVGTQKFIADDVKEQIYSQKPDEFYKGVINGVKIWMNDPQAAQAHFDDKTLTAIKWAYNDLQIQSDDEFVPDPNDPTKKIYSQDLNKQNAVKRVMQRLFPEKEPLGLGNKFVDYDAVRNTAKSVLSNVFGGSMVPPVKAAWKGALGLLGLSKTSGYRAMLDPNSWDMTISNFESLPTDAKDYFENLAIGHVMDGMGDYKKAAEMAIPEFLQTWGISKIGTNAGESGKPYWTLYPIETMVRKKINVSAAQQDAIIKITDTIEKDVMTALQTEKIYGDEFKPQKKDINFSATKIPGLFEETKKPQVRLIPIIKTASNQEIPDYYAFYLNDEGKLTPVISNGKNMMFYGNDILKIVEETGTRYHEKTNDLPLVTDDVSSKPALVPPSPMPSSASTNIIGVNSSSPSFMPSNVLGVNNNE